MKKRIFLPLLAALFLVAFVKVKDVLQDVGTTMAEVKQITLEQIAKKNFDLPRYTAQVRDACKKLPPGVRELTMMNLGKVVKDYVNSPTFATEYMAFLEKPGGRRSGPPPMDEAKWAEERKKKTDQMMKYMANPDKVKNYAQTLEPKIETAQMKLDMLEKSPTMQIGQTKEEVRNELEGLKNLKALYTSDVEAFKIQYTKYTVDQQMAAQMSTYKKSDERNQARINELKDYKSIIKKQLQQFLNVSSNVDYDAETVQKNNKLVFVNPAYETKPAAWKLCYRCGKEAVTGARKFAQEWLKEYPLSP